MAIQQYRICHKKFVYTCYQCNKKVVNKTKYLFGYHLDAICKACSKSKKGVITVCIENFK